MNTTVETSIGDHELPPVVPARAAWRVRLLGAVEAEPTGAGTGASRPIVRWPTRAVAALLARLSLAPHRAHAREELVELLWPGVPPDVGRNRLRQALSTLKTLLETDGGEPLLAADRLVVRVRPGGLTCDATEFEHHLRAGREAAARALYQGALMPGYYDDWITGERDRLADLRERLGEEPPPAAVLPAVPPTAGASAPAMQDAAPSLPSARGLPSYLTRPFGLAGPAARLQAMVRQERLVTVHGPGGSGKTRLVTEVAQALSVEPDNPYTLIAFVPLLACTTADQTLEAVAATIGATGAGTADARVRAHLAQRTALLILDNAEQLEPGADVALAALLQALPRLHLVVTSRRLLGIDGERAFSLTGLPVPEAPRGDDAARSPAVALFVDRARAVLDGFALDAGNAAAVADIVRLLGGMPLAIELAASRLRSLSPAELLRHLRGNGTATLDLLSRHARPAAAAEARHASMRQVVAWSWALLTPAQRRVMQGLSVFDAPARLEAVAAVAGMGPAEALGHLEQLRDDSLVRRSADPLRCTRWSLLQPVREFAAEQQPADEARAARVRLLRWLIGQAGAEAPQGSADWADEIAQVHAAIAGGAADGAGHEALLLALAQRPHWDDGALPMHALLALEQALEGPEDLPAGLRSDAHELLSCARGSAGCSADAVRHAQAAADVAPDPRRRSLALARWAWAAYFDGRYDADYDAVLDEAERCAESSGDVGALAIVLRVSQLIVCNIRMDFMRAEEISARSQVLFEQAGQHAMARSVLVNRLMVRAGRGRDHAEEAVVGLQDVEAAMRAVGDWSGLAHTSRQRGRVLIVLRRFAEAVDATRASLQVARQHQMMQAQAQGLLHLPEALLHGSASDVEAAARLQGYAVLLWERLYPRLNRIEMRELKRARRMLRQRLGGARAEALMLAGRTLSHPDALALALGEALPA